MASSLLEDMLPGSADRLPSIMDTEAANAEQAMQQNADPLQVAFPSAPVAEAAQGTPPPAPAPSGGAATAPPAGLPAMPPLSNATTDQAGQILKQVLDDIAEQHQKKQGLVGPELLGKAGGLLGSGISPFQALLFAMGAIGTRKLRPDIAQASAIRLMNLPQEWENQKAALANNTLQKVLGVLSASETLQNLQQKRLEAQQAAPIRQKLLDLLQQRLAQQSSGGYQPQAGALPQNQTLQTSTGPQLVQALGGSAPSNEDFQTAVNNLLLPGMTMNLPGIGTITGGPATKPAMSEAALKALVGDKLDPIAIKAIAAAPAAQQHQYLLDQLKEANKPKPLAEDQIKQYYKGISDGDAKLLADLDRPQQAQLLTQWESRRKENELQAQRDLQNDHWQQQFQLALNRDQRAAEAAARADAKANGDVPVGDKRINYMNEKGESPPPNMKINEVLDNGYKQYAAPEAVKIRENLPAYRSALSTIDKAETLVKKHFGDEGLMNIGKQRAKFAYMRQSGNPDIQQLDAWNARLLPQITRLVENLPGGRLGVRMIGIEAPQLWSDNSSQASALKRLSDLKSALETSAGNIVPDVPKDTPDFLAPPPPPGKVIK